MKSRYYCRFHHTKLNRRDDNSDNFKNAGGIRRFLSEPAELQSIAIGRRSLPILPDSSQHDYHTSGSYEKSWRESTSKTPKGSCYRICVRETSSEFTIKHGGARQGFFNMLLHVPTTLLQGIIACFAGTGSTFSRRRKTLIRSLWIVKAITVHLHLRPAPLRKPAWVEQQKVETTEAPTV